MSHNKMLIDATHPEETRVVVLKDGRVEEFDYESAARKLLRGSIFLAKVTRVEPSLQAAFVDYGGNRHGFLAFNEVHPDYYQIPYADRQALIDEELRAEAEEEEEAEDSERRSERTRRRRGGRNERGRGRRRDQRQSRGGSGGSSEPRDPEDTALDVTDLLPPEQDAASASPPEGERLSAAEAAARAAARAVGAGDDARSSPTREAVAERIAHASDVVSAPPVEPTASGEATPVSALVAVDDETTRFEDAPHPIGLVEDEGVEQVNGDAADDEEAVEEEQVESVGAEDVEEEVPSRPRRRLRSYKIQEVVKRRQVVLVQVVKEERGTKGAALTSYLSLAGRYTVLMPNTGRGGGISRKITSGMDRKRLKEIADELEVPEGMGLIIRTAGAARTKQEIKRDFEYLLRLWESVRELTLRSTAPCLVYEEGDLIKRSIRDLYSKDIDEIIVAGDAAHAEARDFMGMLMPSHMRHVVKYEGAEPLFSKFRIEQQLNAMFSPYVHLKSGGYLVINQTEALVSIDINSGKSTREFSIEETALATNLEAADEIARQLRLRDLAGLIVIDFIDMEEKRNNRAVERRMKDALRFDRARIQVGRISHFGLLEMSRQRLRTGVLEGSTSQCPHCQGTGIIRSTESVALAVLRGLEDALKVGNPGRLVASTTAAVALYLLNQKRQFIVEMEERTGIAIEIVASEKMHGANFTIDRQSRGSAGGRVAPQRSAVSMESGFAGEDDDEGAEAEEATAAQDDTGDAEARRDGEGRSRRRRRRGRGRGERGQAAGMNGNGAHDEAHAAGTNGNGAHHVEAADDESGEDASDDDTGRDGDDTGGQAGEGDGEAGRGRRRRRGRRGGRRNREAGAPLSGVAAPDAPQPYPDDQEDAEDGDSIGGQPAAAVTSDESAPQRSPAARREPDEVQPAAAVAAAKTPDRPAQLESDATSEPVAAHVEMPEPAAKPASLSARSPRAEPVHGEPVLQRVVVGTTEAGEGPDRSEDESKSTGRKGWWQRRLGI